MILDQKIAVVAGGAGGVGEGIVRALLKNGATVVVPSRTKYKLDRLKEYTADIPSGTLITVSGSVNTEENRVELSNYLHKEFKHLDLAVASLGGWRQGYPLYSYPLDEWNRIIADNLTSHLLAIKALVPMLHPRTGSYFHINGFSADEAYPMAGPVAMMAAAQKSMIQTLAKEVDKTGINVFELILGPMKTRDRLQHGHGQPDWYFPEEIGDYIVHLVEAHLQEQVVHYLLRKPD